jgi:hypothetical protein
MTMQKIRRSRARACRARLAVQGAAVLLAAATLAGCARLEPWVKPYERERLADPVMSWDREPVSTRYMNHVHENREGARGATGETGGGCGCN